MLEVSGAGGSTVEEAAASPVAAAQFEPDPSPEQVCADRPDLDACIVANLANAHRRACTLSARAYTNPRCPHVATLDKPGSHAHSCLLGSPQYG